MVKNRTYAHYVKRGLNHLLDSLIITSVTAMKDLTNVAIVIQDAKHSIANRSILLYTVMKSHFSAAYVKKICQNSQQLQAHQRVLRDERPFSCSLCDLN